MRFPLRALMLVMVWVGLVCMALRTPNPWWNGGMFAAFVLLGLTSVLVAIYRSGSVRAMAIGFIAFGAGYLGIEGSSWPGSAAGVALPTNDIVNWLFTKIHGTDDRYSAATNADPYSYGDHQRAFRGICASTLTVVVGVLGAMIAQFLYNTRPKEPVGQSPA